MVERTVEDRLREEYFALLPDIHRVAEQLETEVRYCILPISLKLAEHERAVVTSRIKKCESALDALRRRQEARVFQTDPPKDYTLTSLPDLAGVRVLAFPRGRLIEIDGLLRKQFPNWKSDPVSPGEEAGEPLALKYHGYCKGASDKIRGEFQIVSMLTGLFWEVEHSAIYKPAQALERVARSREMQRYTNEVVRALRAFEEEFERLVMLEPFQRDRE